MPLHIEPFREKIASAGSLILTAPRAAASRRRRRSTCWARRRAVSWCWSPRSEGSRRFTLGGRRSASSGGALARYEALHHDLPNFAVVPALRGEGLFKALVAERCADARRRGCRLATIYAFEGTSFPIFRKLGFRVVCETRHYFYAHRRPR